jgi:hypothetical protein
VLLLHRDDHKKLCQEFKEVVVALYDGSFTDRKERVPRPCSGNHFSIISKTNNVE